MKVNNIKSLAYQKMQHDFYSAKDFDGIVIYDDLVQALIPIIQSIRQASEYQDLKQLIQKLKTYVKDGKIDKNTSTNDLIFIYTSIQKISLQLRKMLPTFLRVADYDGINYTFWYNDQRYVSEHIDPSWISVYHDGNENHTAQIQLNLEKAIEDIKDGVSSALHDKVQEQLTNHYLKYYTAIKNMYLDVNKHHLEHPEKGSKVNVGNVAEAFERHLAQHHNIGYQTLKESFAEGTKVLSNFDKMIMAQEKILNENLQPIQGQWSTHEPPEKAWIHVRQSLGNQRGTVAGDVWNMQIKSGNNKSSYSHIVNLTSLYNLETGIKNYSFLVDETPVNQAAAKIASYLSGRVSDTSKIVQAKEVNNLMRILLDDKKLKLVEI